MAQSIEVGDSARIIKLWSGFKYEFKLGQIVTIVDKFEKSGITWFQVKSRGGGTCGFLYNELEPTASTKLIVLRNKETNKMES